MSEKVLTKRFEISGYLGTIEEYLATGEIAPVIQVGPDYYGPVRPEDVDALLERLRNG
jgi:hypothetical protein